MPPIPKDDLSPLMQRIESFQRHAEVIEQRAAVGSHHFRQEMARLAAQCRALAVQAHEVAEWTDLGLAGRSWAPSPVLDGGTVTYLFYPHREDGSALTFEAKELVGDGEAEAHALAVLAEHTSAIEVTIWRDEKMIGRVTRDTNGPRPERNNGRPPSP